MKYIIYVLCGIGFLVYYGFAMKFNNPFDYPRGLSSSEYLEGFFFNGNKGLALLILTVFVIITYIWDNVLKNSELLAMINLKDTWIGRLKHLNW